VEKIDKKHPKGAFTDERTQQRATKGFPHSVYLFIYRQNLITHIITNMRREEKRKEE
jgi:hypothetical protein